MPAKLVIQLLGDFQITYNQEPVLNFGATGLQSLLAFLLLHHDIPQPRQRLAYRLWPDSSEANARNNLRQRLYQLRQALPEPDRFLSSDTSTVCWKLDNDQIIDTVVLEQAAAAEKQQNGAAQRLALEQAAQAAQGELLPGCYDEWIFPERERIQTLEESALQNLLSLQERNREYAAAILTGQGLLRLDPLNEALYALLVRYHTLNHNPAGAVRVFHTAREILKHELGIEPGPMLQQAFEQIQQAGSAETLPADPGSPSPNPSLIGRLAEWQQLRDTWQRAANSRGGAGSSNLVLISGEAGIGKSHLAEEMLRWAEGQGILTARAHAYGVEGRLTLAPVTEWLRDPHFQTGFAQLESIWLSEVSRLLPELRIRYPDLPKPEPISEYGQRQHFFEALARAILQTKRAALLFLDDLQWCDQETIEWLHFLLRFNPQAPLLILGTARSEETNPALLRLIQQLRTSQNLTEIELQPLDAAETARLAGQTIGEELDLPAAMRLYHETEGNPLFIIEMMHAGFQVRIPKDEANRVEAFQLPALPPRMQAVILQRLAQLSPIARRTAEVGAVVGQPFTLSLLLKAGYEEEENLVDALDELWQKRIIREQYANTYAFTHEKLREVAYGEVSAPQRRRLHQRIAAAFESIHAPSLEPVSGQIAAHYDQAGVPEKAIPYYYRAGAAAASVYANENAINLLKRGLELLQKVPAHGKRDTEELALLLAITPPYRITKGWTAPELRQALNRALVLCDQVGTPAQRAQVLYGLQSLYVVEGRLEKVEYTYAEMRQLFLQTQGNQPQFAGLMHTGARMHMGWFAEAHEMFETIIGIRNNKQVKDLQDSQGVNYLAHACAWNAHALWFLGFPDTALQCALEGVQIANEYAQPFNQALTATYLAMLQELRADTDAFCQQAEEALTLSEESRAPYYKQWAQILVRFANAGQHPTASHLTALEEAINTFMATGARLRLPYYLSLLARVYGQAGEHEKALQVIERALSEALNNQERCWDTELHRLRGEFLVARASDSVDSESFAEAAFQRSLEVAKRQQSLSLELRAATSLARLWIAKHRPLEGGQLLTAVLNQFTEGQASPDIQMAQSVLQTIR